MRSGGLLAHVLLLEALHTSFGVHDLLRARKEGVAVGTDVQLDVAHRRAGLELEPARATDRRLPVLRMNPGFHDPRILPQRFMESRNSLFVLVLPILSIKNSMASTLPSGLRTLRRIHILFSRSRSTSSSSLRVPEAAISIAGKIRLSARRSEEHTSELQSLAYLVCRLLLEKKNNHRNSGAILGARADA